MAAQQPDLKTLLKPLILQAVREVLLETGVLSKIVTEVVHGLHGSSLVETQQPLREVGKLERKTTPRPQSKAVLEASSDLSEGRRNRQRELIEKTGMGHIFNNIIMEEEVNEQQATPIPARQVIIEEDELELLSEEEKKQLKEERMLEERKQREETRANSELGAPSGGFALKGIAPNDPGLNIKGIMEVAGGKKIWAQFLNKKKRG